MEIKKIFENAAEHSAFIQGGKAAIEEDGSIFDKAKADPRVFPRVCFFFTVPSQNSKAHLTG